MPTNRKISVVLVEPLNGVLSSVTRKEVLADSQLWNEVLPRRMPSRVNTFISDAEGTQFELDAYCNDNFIADDEEFNALATRLCMQYIQGPLVIFGPYNWAVEFGADEEMDEDPFAGMTSCPPLAIEKDGTL